MTTPIKFIGDIHLGRQFRTGVPLHRRGDREKMIREQFAQELDASGYDLIIQPGDLFDKHRVDLNDLVFAADAIRAAAALHPHTQYVFLAGNHDLSRDLEKISSFELAARLCEGLPNVTFVIHKAHQIPGTFVVLIPWSPIKTAAEMVPNLPEFIAKGVKFDLVVGHWDKVAIGNTDNLIPLDALAKITKHVVSGHDHVPDEFHHGDMLVTYVGSMQPLSFAEDPLAKLYLTMDLPTCLGSSEELMNKCVRVLLNPGEELPTDIDCLQLVGKKVGQEDEEDLTVEFEDGLNLSAIFTECMAGVDETIRDQVHEKFEEARVC